MIITFYLSRDILPKPLMNGKRPGHIIFLGRLQKSSHLLRRFVFVVVTAVAGIGLFVQPAFFYRSLGKHEPERMAVGIPGLADLRHLGHMTSHTTAKGMNPVRRAILNRGVAAFTQPVFEQTGLGNNGIQLPRCSAHLGGDQGALGSMNVVTGHTNHTHLGMLALLPVEILLVAVFGFAAGPEIFAFMAVARADLFKVEPQIGFSFVVLVRRRLSISAFFISAPGMT